MMHYNKQWELEIIQRIARRVAKIPGEVDMVFGVFSRGQKTVTKEDFKYTCLKRLQMSKEISEREIDMFLRGNPRLLDSEILTMDQFLDIFSAAIKQARNDILTEEAMQMTTIKKYEEVMRTSNQMQHQASGTFGASLSQNMAEVLASETTTRTNIQASEQEVLDILSRIRQSQGQYFVLEKIKAQCNEAGLISQGALSHILTHVASVSNYEATKVSNFFTRNGFIQIQFFEEYYRKCVQI